MDLRTQRKSGLLVTGFEPPGIGRGHRRDAGAGRACDLVLHRQPGEAALREGRGGGQESTRPPGSRRFALDLRRRSSPPTALRGHRAARLEPGSTSWSNNAAGTTPKRCGDFLNASPDADLGRWLLPAEILRPCAARPRPAGPMLKGGRRLAGPRSAVTRRAGAGRGLPPSAVRGELRPWPHSTKGRLTPDLGKGRRRAGQLQSNPSYGR